MKRFPCQGGELSGRGWLSISWLRPTTWCGRRTYRRVRGLGTLSRCDLDLPGVHCAQKA